MEKEFTKSYAIKRIAELTQQIIDLEIKLEEKQEQIEEWRSLYSALMKDCQMQIEEYNKIKNQLAEQPKQIVEKIREKIVDYNVKYSSAVDVLNCLDLVLDNLLKEMK